MTNPLPLTSTVTPESLDDVIAAVKSAAEGDEAIYPIGGGTGLGYGLTPKKDGIGIDFRKLNRVIDYPARDMTVTVEAGITMQKLAEVLRQEQQQVPIDVPEADRATLGGVIATNISGARRYGYGTMRDYVIGIQAVDARGDVFKGGGRVVKNVAGYDMCKLLTGSLGTLGVITQATLKLKPIPRESTMAACPITSWEQADALLGELVDTQTTPTAIELLCGHVWREDASLGSLLQNDSAICLLLVGLEGTEEEVAWMQGQIEREWLAQGVGMVQQITQQAPEVWRALTEFPVDEQCPLILKLTCVPSGVTALAQAVLKLDPAASLQIHAGDGVIIARLSEFPPDGLAKSVLSELIPVASQHDGNVVILFNPGGNEMTHQSVWGGIDVRFDMMTKVKQQFDPAGRLNPGRFVYLNGQ
jgi:glycolate oxidase FAD binding subunit